MAGYRISPLPGMVPLYLLMRQRLFAAGWTQKQFRDKMDEIAASHTAGSPPSGATLLDNTPNGYARYGIDIGGHKITYQVRPPDKIAIENINLA